jgi:hypothetical protein
MMKRGSDRSVQTIGGISCGVLPIPHNLTAALKTVPLPVRLELWHNQGVQLCQHGGDLSRSFVFWEARHQPLRSVRTILAGRS